MFIEEQGIDPRIEIDGRDETAIHALIRVDDTDIATGRLLPDAHIGRVAVLPAYRGQGHGERVMRVLCQAAQARGDRQVHLAAQDSALNFYLGLGFRPHGPPYLTAGIMHTDMTLDLEQAPWLR